MWVPIGQKKVRAKLNIIPVPVADSFEPETADVLVEMMKSTEETQLSYFRLNKT